MLSIFKKSNTKSKLTRGKVANLNTFVENKVETTTGIGGKDVKSKIKYSANFEINSKHFSHKSIQALHIANDDEICVYSRKTINGNFEVLAYKNFTKQTNNFSEAYFESVKAIFMAFFMFIIAIISRNLGVPIIAWGVFLIIGIIGIPFSILSFIDLKTHINKIKMM